MFITRIRMPVSTSFLLLGLFAQKSSNFLSVVEKSLLGYAVSFGSCFLIYAIFYRGPIKNMLLEKGLNPLV